MSEDSAFTATLKSSGGYDSPWLVVRADSPVELEANLDALTESLLQKVNDVNALFAGAHNATPATTSTGSSSAGQGASVSPIKGGGSPDVKTCEHGVRQYKEGANWAAYMCPLPQNRKSERCKPLDAKTGELWK